MQLHALGSSGLLVSPVCLGTMTFGTPVAEAEAIRLTHAAIDLGINFVDTANAYEGYARHLGSHGGVAAGNHLGDHAGQMRERVIDGSLIHGPDRFGLAGFGPTGPQGCHSPQGLIDRRGNQFVFHAPSENSLDAANRSVDRRAAKVAVAHAMAQEWRIGQTVGSQPP